MQRIVTRGLIIALMVVSLLTILAPPTLAQEDYVLRLTPNATVYRANAATNISQFWVQWDATLTGTGTSQPPVTLMNVTYQLGNNVRYAAFVWNSSGNNLCIDNNGNLKDLAESYSDMGSGAWYSLNISVSITGNDLHIVWYVNGTLGYQSTSSVYDTSFNVTNVSAKTKSLDSNSNLLYINNVQDSQGNSETFDYQSDSYFIHSPESNVDYVTKDSVPFFSSAFIGALVVLGVVLLFRRR